MKVVLARPGWNYPKGRSEATYNRVWPPLELANCAAIFREAGHDAEIVDAHALNLPPEKLAAACTGTDLVILTSTGLDRWQCPYNDAAPFVAAAQATKGAGLRVVATGFHPTVAPDAVLRATRVDAVIRGEPEGVAADLARGVSLREIKGISYLDGGALVSNPDRALVDLETLPVPAFDLFDTRRYFYEILGDRFLLFEATRGCPYQCTFCSKVMYGDAFRRKTAEQVCREIDYALEHTGVESAYFIDLEFTVAGDLAEAISRHLVEIGSPIEWCCQTRADRVDADLLKLMREAGCRLIHVGVESGSQKVLESSGKNTSKEAILRGVREIRAAGIETLAFFMFGLPGETDADREESIRFALELDPTYASFHFATPYPGSRLFETSGFKVAADLSFPLVPPGADLADLKRWVRRGLRRFYLRSGYVYHHVLKGNPAKWRRQMGLFLSYFK
ncbi:MAG: radical SAM protein [Planctomycetes bacterium]|nr:radical SAM protein [Planctomycetota bacterium]